MLERWALKAAKWVCAVEYGDDDSGRLGRAEGRAPSVARRRVRGRGV